MKKYFLAMLLIALPALAEIQVSTSINDVYYRGASELIGSMQLTVTDNDMPDASVENPYYIRVAPDKNATLATTLVNLNSEDATLSKPIDLRLELWSNNDGLSVIAPRDAVSIVRWVAGEDAIWIRITHPTSSWLQDGDAAVAPSDNQQVQFIFGVYGFDYGDDETKENLPFNLRQGEEPGEEGTSTLVCYDLRNSTVTADSTFSTLIHQDVDTFVASAEISPGVYSNAEAHEADIRAIGEFTMARGRDLVFALSSAVSAPLEAFRPIDSGNTFSLSNRLVLQIDPGLTENAAMEGVFGTDSRIVLTVAEDAAYGFPAGSVSLGGDWEATSTYDQSFTHGEETLFRQATLTYTGSPRTADNLLAEVMVDLAVSGSDLVRDIFVNYQVEVARSTRCGQTFIDLGGSQWYFAEVSQGRIIPHLTRSSGEFTTQLLVANDEGESVDYEIELVGINGESIAQLTDSLNAGETALLDLDELVPDTGGYARISEHNSVKVSVMYRAKGENKAPAQLHETRDSAKRWRIYPGQNQLTFDGAAIVNLGDEDAQLSITTRGFDGSSLSTTTQPEPLQPGHKTLLVFNNQHEDVECYYEVVATQPIAFMALRGDLQSNFLWQNRALPLD